MIIKVATIPQISVKTDLFPLPDTRYVLGLILILKVQERKEDHVLKMILVIS